MKQSLRKHIFMILTVISVLAVFIGLIRTSVHSQAVPLDFSDNKLTNVSDSWHFTQTDTPVIIPGTYPAVNGTCSISREFLPSELDKGVLLVRNIRQFVTVYADDNIIYTIKGSDANTNLSANEYCIVSLPDNDTICLVTIEFSGCMSDICTIDPVFLGTQSQVLNHLLYLDSTVIIVLLFLAFLFILTLALCILMNVNKIHDKRIYCLLLVILFAMGYMVFGTWSIVLLPISYAMITATNYVCLACLAIPLSLYAYFSTREKNSAVFFTAIVALINVAAQCLLAGFGIFTFFQMIVATHIILFIVLLVSVVALAKQYRSFPSPDELALLVTFCIPVGIYAFTMFSFWFNDGTIFMNVFSVGVIVFILMLILSAFYTLTRGYISNQKSQAELKLFHKLSVQDGLTELGNRRSFDMHTEAIEKTQYDDVLLLFMDLNGLKQINDNYGHETGDELLKAAAISIRNAYLKYGHSYRLGGDEFAVIVENPELPDEAYFQLLDEEIAKYNKVHNISLSIAKGCEHLYTNDHIRRPISLWKSNADKNMYAEKLRLKMTLPENNIGIVADEVDLLTGALNIEGFRTHARQLLDVNSNASHSLWYFDIKKFKFVNDYLGYEMGDNLIKYLVTILMERLNNGELCGRISGDTVLVLAKHSSMSQIEEFFEYVATNISSFFESIGSSLRIEISAGVYLVQHEDTKRTNINQMIDWANVAQKSIKEKNGSNYAVFGMEMWQAQWREIIINQSIDSAIENRELEVWLQPQYNYIDNRIIGAEALCRWSHSKLGWLSPAEFITALEKSGQITKLDTYIWEEACKLMRQWSDSSAIPCIPISVNMSRNDLIQKDIFNTLDNLMSKYNLPHKMLKLEITESAYMERPEELISAVNELHARGYTVEMDDFGSGFSSLNMLKDVPVDVLKIDIRFLKGDEHRNKGGRIISAIANLARDLSIPVLTEGVETEDQARFLSSLGCHLMQGYYFSKPLPVDAMENLLRNEATAESSAVEPERISVSAYSSDFINSDSNISVVNYSSYQLSQPTNRIVQIDENFERVTGYSWNDILDMKLTQSDIIPEEDRETYWSVVYSIMNQSSEIFVKHRFVKKDGTIINVFCCGKNFVDEYTGEPRALIRIFTEKDTA